MKRFIFLVFIFLTCPAMASSFSFYVSGQSLSGWYDSSDSSCSSVSAVVWSAAGANSVLSCYSSSDFPFYIIELSFPAGKKTYLVTDYLITCDVGFRSDSATLSCVSDSDSGADSGSGSPSDALSVLQLAISNLQVAQSDNAVILQSILAAQSEPFNEGLAWAAFSFFFSSIMLLWAVAKGGGLVLSAIRRGGRV